MASSQWCCHDIFDPVESTEEVVHLTFLQTNESLCATGVQHPNNNKT